MADVNPHAAGTSATAGARRADRQGKPSEAGQVYLLAMVPGNPKLLTLEAASGATFLDRSVNGGKTWARAEYHDGGTGLRDLPLRGRTRVRSR